MWLDLVQRIAPGSRLREGNRRKAQRAATTQRDECTLGSGKPPAVNAC
jgi:hypothetical protein